MSTIKEGEMFKRGKVNTDWKLRTFILDKKMLSYFKGSVSCSCPDCSTVYPTHIDEISSSKVVRK